MPALAVLPGLQAFHAECALRAQQRSACVVRMHVHDILRHCSASQATCSWTNLMGECHWLLGPATGRTSVSRGFASILITSRSTYTQPVALGMWARSTCIHLKVATGCVQSMPYASARSTTAGEPAACSLTAPAPASSTSSRSPYPGAHSVSHGLTLAKENEPYILMLLMHCPRRTQALFVSFEEAGHQVMQRMNTEGCVETTRKDEGRSLAPSYAGHVLSRTGGDVHGKEYGGVGLGPHVKARQSQLVGLLHALHTCSSCCKQLHGAV